MKQLKMRRCGAAGGCAMRAGLTKLYTGFARGKAAICAFCLLCYAALTAWAGGSPAAMLCVWAAAAVYVLAPGWLAMRLSRMAEGAPALALPLTVLFGTGFLAVCCCVAARFQAVWVLRAVPLVPAAGAAACFLREMREKKRRGALRSARPDARAAAAGAAGLHADFPVRLFQRHQICASLPRGQHPHRSGFSVDGGQRQEL
jgi:hypothetical protein